MSDDFTWTLSKSALIKSPLIPEETEESSTLYSNSGELLVLYHQAHTDKLHLSAIQWLVKTHEWCPTTHHQGHSLQKKEGEMHNHGHNHRLSPQIWTVHSCPIWEAQEPPWFHYSFFPSAANLLNSTQWC